MAVRPSHRSVVHAERLGVFSDNRNRPIHRWYPFVEGYSADLVVQAIAGSRHPNPVIFDPFGGSGTTALAASEHGHDAYFTEVNPYLAWVADVKVNKARAAFGRPDLGDLLKLASLLDDGAPLAPSCETHPLIVADTKRQFFPAGVAETTVGILAWIASNLSSPVAELAVLACTTSLIPASNMVRRTDLRRRRAGDPLPTQLLPTIAIQLRAIFEDVRSTGATLQGSAIQIGADIRCLTTSPKPFDLIVTSPPYLNGTNYCRNTKLELLALRLVADEAQLAGLRTESITAGINNVSSRRASPTEIASVEEVAARLDAVAYDKRVPSLVRGYFSDMQIAFRSIRRNAEAGTPFLLDIGDSRFAGVHVPTHDLLVDVAHDEGWSCESVDVIRTRRSYDGTPLTQVLLRLKAS